MPGLQTDHPLSSTPQPVSDDTGVASALSLSTTSVGIGTPSPEVALHVAGSLKLERNGSSELALFSHGMARSSTVFGRRTMPMMRAVGY